MPANMRQLEDLKGYLSHIAWTRKAQGDGRHRREIKDELLAEIGMPNLDEAIEKLQRMAHLHRTDSPYFQSVAMMDAKTPAPLPAA